LIARLPPPTYPGFKRSLIGETRKEVRMIDISHILVLSQSDFVQRQISGVLRGRFGRRASGRPAG